ncbi:hypothetical protein V499_00236 [Pseudogymnoascus sp. VKM F-103]|nr:hypothetical protein V499_00236 [Pseudogymnoascus sp. VKM F-103]
MTRYGNKAKRLVLLEAMVRRPSSRQPRRNHSLVHQRVSSLQTFPEQIRAPNNTQIENEEIVEVPKPTELQRSPLHSKHLRATVPESIPPSKSQIIHGCTRERAIDSVKRWLEPVSGSKLGSCQERRSHSDSIQNHSEVTYSGNIPIPRNCTNSAPVEGGTRDTEKFAQALAIPLIQSSRNGEDHGTHCDDCSCSRSATPEDASTTFTMLSRQSLVENPMYRAHLKQNGIDLLPSYNHLPGNISDFVNHLWKYRNPIGPLESQIQSDKRLAKLRTGSAESEVASYFQEQLFLVSEQTDILKGSLKLPMSKLVVPGVDSELRVSIPVPDILYGYDSLGAFTDEEQVQLNSMVIPVFGNNDGLVFPFFAIEQKGDGPVSRGSLWVATNQCLGASASCVNIVERFNQLLRQCNDNNDDIKGGNIDVGLPNSTSFSIAMNGSEARLYVTWKHDEFKYHTAIVDSFLLQRPMDFLKFRRYVLNILDWGMSARLTAIRNSLGHLREESRKMASRRAKARLSPSMEDRDNGQAQKRRRGYRRAVVDDTESSMDPLTL